MGIKNGTSAGGDSYFRYLETLSASDFLIISERSDSNRSIVWHWCLR